MDITDITLVPVPRDRRSAFEEFSRRMAQVYLEHGATSVVDHWQVEDAVGQAGFHAAEYAADALGDVAGLVSTGPSEAVVVTLTRWPSRDVRDRGVAAALADPRVVATLDEEPVFDGARVRGGTFEVSL